MIYRVEVDIADEQTIEVYLQCRHWVAVERVDINWEADKVSRLSMQKCIVLSYKVKGEHIGEIIGRIKRDVMKFDEWITGQYGKVEVLKGLVEKKLHVKKVYKCPLTRLVCMRDECMMYDWRTERCGLLNVEVYCDG